MVTIDRYNPEVIWGSQFLGVVRGPETRKFEDFSFNLKIYHQLFNYCAIVGYLDGFLFFAVVNKAEVSFSILKSWYEFLTVS